jgi:hypothetical protein
MAQQHFPIPVRKKLYFARIILTINIFTPVGNVINLKHGVCLITICNRVQTLECLLREHVNVGLQ